MNYLFEAVHAARSLAFPAISTSVITSTLVRAWCVFRNEIIPLRPQMRATCATIYSPITRLHRPKGQRLCLHKPSDKRIQRLERTLSVTSFPFSVFCNQFKWNFRATNHFTTRYIEIRNVWLTSNKGIIVSTIYAKECINMHDEIEDGIYAKIFSAWNNIRVYCGYLTEIIDFARD